MVIPTNELQNELEYCQIEDSPKVTLFHGKEKSKKDTDEEMLIHAIMKSVEDFLNNNKRKGSVYCQPLSTTYG